ncbi:hypothetical protein CASFOL_039232 [Castilleja foliolosa]|uniref:Protein BZR1 homolog n=1 Tax=Castilleja foliolosa TaxID=1961234 RepID=A0ABD3BHF3_9LAMI
MKEASGERNGVRSAVEREKTKMRERQRRSITTNIFHGLRKHGGYRLSPRADINEVLRHLAHEAGWTVDPDGTTYRAVPNISNGNSVCPLCGCGRKSPPPTLSGRYLGGGGECSTTNSPRRESAVNSLSSGGVMAANESLLAVYMCGAAVDPENVCGGGACDAAAYGEGQQMYLLREASVSNQNTPAGSPGCDVVLN